MSRKHWCWFLIAYQTRPENRNLCVFGSFLSTKQKPHTLTSNHPYLSHFHLDFHLTVFSHFLCAMETGHSLPLSLSLSLHFSANCYYIFLWRWWFTVVLALICFLHFGISNFFSFNFVLGTCCTALFFFTFLFRLKLNSVFSENFNFSIMWHFAAWLLNLFAAIC